MPRICGVCRISPREGEEMRCVRVREEDAEELRAVLKLDFTIEPGLYQAIEEVVNAYRPIVAARLGVEEGEVTNGMLI